MDTLIEIYNAPWFDAVLKMGGFVITIIAIAVAVLAVRRPDYFSYVGPRLACHILHTRLLDRGKAGARSSQQLPRRLEIRYGRQKITRLTRTWLMLWNIGNETITKRQIITTDRLRFEFDKDTRVLDSQILKNSRDVNEINIGWNSQRPNELRIGFDYLDHGDGLVIEVLHTGEVGTGALQGTIQGMPKGIVDLSNVPPVGTGAKFGMTAAGLLCLLLVYLTIEQLLTKEASVGIMVGRILFATFAAAASVTLWIQLMRLRRRFPKTLAMKEFFQ